MIAIATLICSAITCGLVAALTYRLWPCVDPDATPRTEQGYLSTARDLVATAMHRPPARKVYVADDLHQARMERSAHRDGATLQPPPRYR